MIALFVIVAIVGGPAALLAALYVADEGDWSHSVRPVPPRPARPADPVAWVDPRPVHPDAAWNDPEAVAA